MTTFVLLADNDPAIDLRTFLKQYNHKDGTRIPTIPPSSSTPSVSVSSSSTVKEEKVDDGFEEVGSGKGKKKGNKKEVAKEEPKKATAATVAATAAADVVAEEKLTREQKIDLVDKQFIALLPLLFNNTNGSGNGSNDDDIDTGFSLVLHVMSELDSKVQQSVVSKLIAALTSSPTVATSLKLTLLTSLFNSSYLEQSASSSAAAASSTATQRATIYMALLQLALSTGNARLLSGSYGDIDVWCNEWKLSKAKQAELYLLLAQITKAADEHVESASFTLKYLKMVEAASLPLASAKDVAVAAVISVLSSSSMQAYDEYINLAAVAQLKDDKKTSSIYQLLKIFAGENVDSYTKLAAEKKDLLAGTGLMHDDVVRKLRTLTISSLGLASERITYSDLAKKLSLSDVNEVEAVVIDAVLSGRVDAKLDQEAQIVNIQRTSPRAFSASSWAELGGKLRAWRDSVGTVLDSLENVQSPSSPSST